MDTSPTTIKEVFHVAGDQPDPTGMSNVHGATASYQLDRNVLGRPWIHVRPKGGNGEEIFLVADVYALEGAPLTIQLYCPLCMAAHGGAKNGLTIRADRKAVSYDPQGVPPPFPGWEAAQVAHAFPQGVGGRLSVASFACTWEATPELLRTFGLARCTFAGQIVDNVFHHA